LVSFYITKGGIAHEAAVLQNELTHSAAPSPTFEGGVKKHCSGSTLSKPQHLCWGVEGLTFPIDVATTAT
jgi:hypothetical protein